MLRFPDRNMASCRIFCIGCNYHEHMKELGHSEGDRCVIFMKPPTCLVQVGEPVEIPKGLGPVHHEVELVVAIGREGSSISRDEAPGYIAGLTLGLDLTLRAVQARLRKNGHPWELSKSFEQSAPIGSFIPWEPGIDLANVDMKCLVNDEVRQEGNTRDMIFPVDRLISNLSRTWRLRPGDLIFTGTPPGVAGLQAGDTVTIESSLTGAFHWEID